MKSSSSRFSYLRGQFVRGASVVGFAFLAQAAINTVQALPPVLSKSFTPATVGVAATSTLNIVLTNPNAAPAVITTFTETLPIGTATVGAATTTCGGTLVTAAGSVTLTGGSIPTNGSCTITVGVSSIIAGNYINTLAAGALVTSNFGSNTAAATATLSVTASPLQTAGVIAKSFNPSTIRVGGASVVTINLINPTIAASGLVSFTDILPAGLVYGIAGNTCGGTLTLAANVLTLTGGTSLASGAQCTITLSAGAPTVGNFVNSLPNGALVFAAIPSALSAAVSASLAVADIILPPTIFKSFSPDCIDVCEVSLLTITLNNNSTIPAVLSTPFVDKLPHHLDVCDHVVNTCGGTATVFKNTISLTGGTIPARGTCSLTVEVSTDRPGCYHNSIRVGALQTNVGSNEFPASADLTVFDRERNHEGHDGHDDHGGDREWDDHNRNLEIPQ